jgi:hypothetical protein
MLIASGRAVLFVALHMPHFQNHVKRIREQSEIILNSLVILRRFAGDLTDTVRDTLPRIQTS